MLERLEGGTQSGLYMGKRLSRGNLYRMDDKIFEKTIKPEDGFSIAFAVLLDLSGSMSSGGRIESAQKAGLVMYTFCFAGIWEYRLCYMAIQPMIRDIRKW